MSVILIVIAVWTLVVLSAVALCVQAARADEDTAEAFVPDAGRFRAVA